jgi:hypothetical protein
MGMSYNAIAESLFVVPVSIFIPAYITFSYPTIPDSEVVLAVPLYMYGFGIVFHGIEI